MKGTQAVSGSRLKCSAPLEELSRSSAVVTLWKNGLVQESLETGGDASCSDRRKGDWCFEQVGSQRHVKAKRRNFQQWASRYLKHWQAQSWEREISLLRGSFLPVFEVQWQPDFSSSCLSHRAISLLFLGSHVLPLLFCSPILLFLLFHFLLIFFFF